MDAQDAQSIKLFAERNDEEVIICQECTVN